MTHDTIGNALVLYRLESAREKLNAAKDLLKNKHYKDSVSRSYYAIFTAARALVRPLNNNCFQVNALRSPLYLLHAHFEKARNSGLKCAGLKLKTNNLGSTSEELEK